MKGLILYKRAKAELADNDHGVIRLLAEAKKLSIDLEVCSPQQIEIITPIKNKKIFINSQLVPLPDFVIPRMGAESSYRAIALVKYFESLGVYCVNNAGAIEKVKDKLWVSQLLTAAKLPTPKTLLLNNPVSLPIIEQQIGFPLVIKNIASARGIGVYLCESANNLIDLLGILGTQFSQPLIAQQFISNSYGRDLRVFVLGNKVIGCMLRKAKNNFKANYSLGGEVEAFSLTPEIEQLAIKCAKIVDLAIAGIDLLFDKQGFLICEANSAPGFKGMELATGDNVAAQILDYVVKQAGIHQSKKNTA